MIVIYEGNDEVLIATQAEEHRLLEEFFAKDTDRDLREYIRTEAKNFVRIELRAHANIEKD